MSGGRQGKKANAEQLFFLRGGTAAGGALMMDCLPADEYGQPLAAARDMNLHAWAWRI